MSAQKTVKNVICIEIVACNHPQRVNSDWEGSLTQASTGVGSVECNELAVRNAKEAVIDLVRVRIVSGNRTLPIDTGGGGAIRVRNVKRNKCVLRCSRFLWVGRQPGPIVLADRP